MPSRAPVQRLTFLLQPSVAMFAYEIVVVQLGIRGVDSIDLFALARAEALVRIEAPKSFQQSLPPQNFVQARNASGEFVRSVEKRGVAVGHVNRLLQYARRNRLFAFDEGVTFIKKLHRAFRPNRP